MELSDSLRRNVVDLHGRAGAEWLARLPELAGRCAARWSLSLEQHYPDASYSYVARATRRDGAPTALKLSFPDQDAGREAAALRAFDGRGCVALLDDDPSAAAFLLARPEPGHHLAKLCEADDERATSIAAGIVRTLPR